MYYAECGWANYNVIFLYLYKLVHKIQKLMFLNMHSSYIYVAMAVVEITMQEKILYIFSYM